MDDFGSLIPPDPSEGVESLSPGELERLGRSLRPAEHVEADQQDRGVVKPPPDSPTVPPEKPLDPAVADPSMSLANMNMIRRRDVRLERMKRGFRANTITGLTKGQYVERELAITRAQIASGSLKNILLGGRDNVDRTRSYAEWRWEAFERGEVASL